MPEQTEKTTTTTQEPTTQTVHGSMPDHLKEVPLEDTFLPEAKEEETVETPPAEETKPKEETKPAEETKPGEKEEKTETTTTTPAQTETTTKPKDAANEEIVDKTVTTPTEPTIYAGKYKTVEDLKQGITELGGDYTGVEDPKALEAVYKSLQGVYNRARQEVVPPKEDKKEEPKPWQLDDAEKEAIIKEVDWDKIDSMKDVLEVLIPAIFNRIPKYLPTMYPQKPGQPQMTAQEMAAVVTNTNINTDSLAFIEAKIPRLTTDTKFRNAFATHLQTGKQAGTYPKVMKRDDMAKAMKDFLDNARQMADEATKLEEKTTTETKEDKGAAGTPDNAGTPASTEPPQDEDGDILTSIVGAKVAKDEKFNF